MRWSLWIAFAALCILSGTSWAIPGAMTGELPPLEQQGFLFGVIGLTAVLFTARERRLLNKIGWCARLAAASVCFFAMPLVAIEYTRGSVSATSRSALFAMVPVVVVMVLAAGDVTGLGERGARRSLIPALIGLGGLLLLLPLEFSGSVHGRVMLGVVCAAVVLVGFASVWLYRLLQGVGLVRAIAVMGVANAVVLLSWSFVHEEMVWRWSGLVSVMSVQSLVDVVEILLLVWLLREMRPVPFASRYLVIPLVTILESFILMRPEWTVRIGFGTVLLAVGAGMLLFLRPGEEETMLSLR
jgi:drug/metabolite transporter (DMT)-like permease